MAEVHEVHEVEVQEKRRSGIVVPFVMFLLGGALIAAVVVAVLNIHSTISWPAGQVSLGSNTAVADSGDVAVAPPAPVTSLSAPVVTPNELPPIQSAPVETLNVPAAVPPAADATVQAPDQPAASETE